MGSWAVQLANAVANTEKTKLLNDLQLRRFISGGKAVAKSDGEGLTFTLSSAGTASLMLRYRLSGGRRKEFMIGNDPRACGHSFVDRAAAERGWVQGTRPPQDLCLARKGNAANSPFQRQPEGKAAGHSPLVVTLLMQMSTCKAARA